jgi:acetylornithine deacetylase/succinyl-diaminopimelate desuccinylase-like protein
MTTNTERGVDAALDFLRENDERHLKQLDEFLRIPSVSADATARADVEQAAQWIATELTRIGVEHAQLHETSGHPIVTGDWLHAGPDRPTVLVY